jgi:hypothetical protein
MKVLILLLQWFGYVWITTGSIFIVMGIEGTWMSGGFAAVQELMSPFSVRNNIALVITLGPGIGALVWANQLAKKHAKLPH